jgi:hypothetical protein
MRNSSLAYRSRLDTVRVKPHKPTAPPFAAIRFACASPKRREIAALWRQSPGVSAM